MDDLKQPSVGKGPKWLGLIMGSDDVEGPALLGPEGHIWFSDINDAELASYECNRAYAQGRLSLEGQLEVYRKSEQAKVAQAFEATKRVVELEGKLAELTEALIDKADTIRELETEVKGLKSQLAASRGADKWENGKALLKGLIAAKVKMYDDEGKASTDALGHYRKAHKEFELRAFDLADEADDLLAELEAGAPEGGKRG
jgi:chromosome segregation ATPase